MSAAAGAGAEADGDPGEIRFVVIGDSFSEGVGDELPDGTVRGWADLAAQGWANALGRPISYANLAIRGRLVGPIVEEQLEPALALRPTLMSFVGGGNDILRPRTTIADIAERFAQVLARCDEEGVQLLLHSVANPSAGLPMRRIIERRGEELSDAVLERLGDRPDVLRSLNWPDTELAGPAYWAEDRLHLNTRGHHRVAARVLETVGVDAPKEWWSLPEDAAPARLSNREHFRRHVQPWIRRRLRRESSGDGRAAKYPEWTTIAPTTAPTEGR